MLKNFCWVPSLYFSQGLPYVVVTSVSVIMFTQLGMDNEKMALWTSVLALPWSCKPLWAPVLDIFGRKRVWILVLQFLLGIGFMVSSLFLERGIWPLIIGSFLVFGFISATFDAAADGFYMLSLDTHGQSFFSGVRSTFYRLSMIAGQGGLIWLAGVWQQTIGIEESWSRAIILVGVVIVAFSIYHMMTLPPESKEAGSDEVESSGWEEFAMAFVSFFQKKHVARALLFILGYRIAEAPLGKIAMPFLNAARIDGGLELSTRMLGILYGGFGVGALLAGGLAGGVVIARYGLKPMFFVTALAINIPDAVYIYLAYARPESLTVIGLMVGIEQFGYGFGFSSYMLFMASFAADSGKYRTSHYAIMTGFMALGVMLPGMISGALQKRVGYLNFFTIIMVLTLASFAVTLLARRAVPEGFGRKKS